MGKINGPSVSGLENTFAIGVTNLTERNLKKAVDDGNIVSFIEGVTEDTTPGFRIILDQGLNSTEAGGNSAPMPNGLVENQYIIEMDNRFGTIVNEHGHNPLTPSFIDDDQIASYFISLNQQGSNYIEKMVKPNHPEQALVSPAIAGPLGTRLHFSIRASLELRGNDYLFTRLGSTVVINSVTYKYIDASIRVSGGTTGYRVDVPVRFLKWQSGGITS